MLLCRILRSPAVPCSCLDPRLSLVCSDTVAPPRAPPPVLPTVRVPSSSGRGRLNELHCPWRGADMKPKIRIGSITGFVCCPYKLMPPLFYQSCNFAPLPGIFRCIVLFSTSTSSAISPSHQVQRVVLASGALGQCQKNLKCDGFRL